jgi:hypothetical protein
MNYRMDKPVAKIKPFLADPPKIGRPVASAVDGPMPNFSIRVPQSLREQLDFVYRNTDARSRSDVVVRSLREWLPKEVAKIRKKLGLPP